MYKLLIEKTVGVQTNQFLSLNIASRLTMLILLFLFLNSILGRSSNVPVTLIY